MAVPRVRGRPCRLGPDPCRAAALCTGQDIDLLPQRRGAGRDEVACRAEVAGRGVVGAVGSIRCPQVFDARRDFLRKTSTDLVRRFEPMAVEDLAGPTWPRTGCFRKRSAAPGGRFRDLLTYRAQRCGACLVVVDRFYPSYKTCATCRHLRPALSLATRRGGVRVAAPGTTGASTTGKSLRRRTSQPQPGWPPMPRGGDESGGGPPSAQLPVKEELRESGAIN
jgi:hypothetical protein